MARQKKPRRDLYQEVTDTIIAQLEQGCVPWVQPWGLRDQFNSSDDGCEVGGTALGLPENAHTGRTYSGINILLLWTAAIDGGHAKQSWLTFKQALALGGNVRKGERGTTVVYADTFTPKDEKAKAQEEDRAPQRIGFLKRYTVFNVSQCEGLSDEVHKLAAPMPEREAIPHAEALIEATGADFRIGGDRAYYVPSEDYIQVPPQQVFFEQINFYRTCFHEIGHNADFLIMPS